MFEVQDYYILCQQRDVTGAKSTKAKTQIPDLAAPLSDKVDQTKIHALLFISIFYISRCAVQETDFKMADKKLAPGKLSHFILIIMLSKAIS